MAVINTFMVFRIILTNAVKYVTNVEGYDRRIQSAINIQGRKMQRRAEFPFDTRPPASGLEVTGPANAGPSDR